MKENTGEIIGKNYLKRKNSGIKRSFKMKKTIIFIIIMLTFLSLYSEEKKYELDGFDGPYIIHQDGKIREVSVDQDNNISDKITNKTEFECRVNNADKDSFTFTLKKEIVTDKAIFDSVEKMLMLSDIEGNFNGFYSLLKSNNVIDEKMNWIFGDGHLVLVGDFVDRGKNVTQCLWLIYKLEEQAKAAGGFVHFILGNHEIMTFKPRIRYMEDKYIAVAQQVSGEKDPTKAFKLFQSRESELIRWMKTKNTVVKIGDILFTHAGISSELIEKKYTIEKINNIARDQIDEMLNPEYEYNESSKFIFGRTGPLWYRGLVTDYKDYYKKITEDSLNKILTYFEVKHIAIGHTIIDDNITTDFNNKLLLIDIHHSNEKFSDKTQAILIEKNSVFRVDGKGSKQLLFETVE